MTDSLLTDTVGFIRKLPHTVIESFKATLEEVHEADLLIHVVDLSHQLFAPRSWGSMAEAETYAHLERLRVLGEIKSREEAGVISYRV